jgi:hypothetical protein
MGIAVANEQARLTILRRIDEELREVLALTEGFVALLPSLRARPVK